MTTIQNRRGTAAAWTSANPILASGEVGFETDTWKWKVGNGSSTWNVLAYANSVNRIADASTVGKAIMQAASPTDVRNLIDAATDIAPGFVVDNARAYGRYYELGTAFKSATLPAGPKPVVVAEVTGESGVLTRLWYAADGADLTRNSFVEDKGILRVYLDNDTTPAIEAPVNDFFGYAARADVYNCPRMGRATRFGSQSGAWRIMWAPFTQYMRVEYENTSATDVYGFYANADYRLTQKRGAYQSYKLVANKDMSAARYSEFEVADIDGSGQLEAVTLSYSTSDVDTYGFLEGNFEIYVDGETVPSIIASGTEDFFGGAWYNMPVGGYPSGIAGPSDVAGSHVSMYRFFLDDPVGFNSNIRIVVPIGQRGQGTTPTTVEVSGTASVWLADPPAIAYDEVNLDSPVLQDAMSYTGALSSGTWGQAGDRTQATGTGTAISFPDSADAAAQDMRCARKGVTLPVDGYWLETKVRIRSSSGSTDKTAGLIVTGGTPDPWYGSACHIQVQKDTQYLWRIITRDDFDTPFSVTIGSGKELTDQWIWLACKVKGTTRTAYYKMDGAAAWNPIGTWTTTRNDSAFGVFSWQTAAEFDQLNVYPLTRVTA